MPSIWSCSGWVYPCRACCQPRGARSYRTFSPLPVLANVGGVFSVALSVGLRRPGVTWHPVLWSPDFPPLSSCDTATVQPVPNRQVSTAGRCLARPACEWEHPPSDSCRIRLTLLHGGGKMGISPTPTPDRTAPFSADRSAWPPPPPLGLAGSSASNATSKRRVSAVSRLARGRRARTITTNSPLAAMRIGVQSSSSLRLAL